MNDFNYSIITEVAPIEHESHVVLAGRLTGWAIAWSNLIQSHPSDDEKSDKGDQAPHDEEPPEYSPCSIHVLFLAHGEHVHPLPAIGEDELGGDIQTTINAANTAAGSGLHDADCSHSIIVFLVHVSRIKQ